MQYRDLRPYKYQLTEIFNCKIDIPKIIFAQTQHIVLGLGEITIWKGYAWDGPSGPTIDTKTFMRGALVHDALYQLMREGKVDIKHREQADKILRQLCLEDGMCRVRAWYVYHSVRLFSEKYARPR